MHNAYLTIQTMNGVYVSHVCNERDDLFYARVAGAVQGAVNAGHSVVGLEIMKGE